MNLKQHAPAVLAYLEERFAKLKRIADSINAVWQNYSANWIA
jgi:hypothetical protein